MISIIVPVYNVKDYVEKCLDSIAKQTLSEFEVIVVDDGSTDGSGEVVDAFCEGKENFRVIHKENGGLMSAWTEGVKNSIGKYIGFVDSDDYILPEMYRKMIDKALEYDADIVFCDRYTEEEDKSLTAVSSQNILDEGLYTGKDIKKIYDMVFPLPGYHCVSKARWNKIFKSDLLKNNLKYCECLSRTFEDRYITPACIFSAKSFYYLAEPFYVYVPREGSNSGMYKKELMGEIQRMYSVQKQMLRDKGLFDDYKENWEYIFLDYIRVYIGRNILRIKGFKTRLESAQKLFNDQIAVERLQKYGKQMDGKLGKVVWLSYKLKAPVLLVFFSYLA